jgi:hypothetical protein
MKEPVILPSRPSHSIPVRRAPNQRARPQSCCSIDRDWRRPHTSLSPSRSHGPPAVGARRLRSYPYRWVPSPVSATPKARADKTDSLLPIDSMVRSRGEGMRVHIYSRRPRFMAVFLCRGLLGPAVPISRRNARRINSGRLISSRRALSSRSCWTSSGSRNVTGTLPFGSFVLGMP